MDQRTLGPTHLRVSEPEVLAAQLWSFVHGYITLELAELFAEFDDPVAHVLVPMGVNLAVGLGDERERAGAPHKAAARLTTRSRNVGRHRRTRHRHLPNECPL